MLSLIYKKPTQVGWYTLRNLATNPSKQIKRATAKEYHIWDSLEMVYIFGSEKTAGNLETALPERLRLARRSRSLGGRYKWRKVLAG